MHSRADMNIADVAEARAFLDAHPHIEAIELIITDPHGVARGKIIARDELEAVYVNGRCIAGSIIGLDITGEDVEGTGLVWEVGDADKVCRPIASTLVVAPWNARPSAQVLITMFDVEGAPAAADPRHVLAAAIERMQGTGFNPVMAAEIEFYLVARNERGQFVPAPGLRSNEPATRHDAYGLAKLQDMTPVFEEIYAAASAQGLPFRTLMSEYGFGQFEITLLHRDDVLRAMDEATMFKRLVRGIASKHGLTACFMAKPFAEFAGSGMHMHLSLQNEKGENVFASDEAAGTELLRFAIGGMQSAMAESMLIFAPNANSYRRFRRMSYAPVAPTWGVNNRSVSLRVPLGPSDSRHVEQRVSGADANPYLAAAVLLEAARIGLERKLDPGPAVTGNGYVNAPSHALPLEWRAAINAAEKSEFLRTALGADFHRIFITIKKHEFEKYNAVVPELDFQWYLELV